MPKLEGILKNAEMRGKLEDFVIYQLNGETIIRRIGQVSKERYKSGLSFTRMRQNQSEFALAVQLAKPLYSISCRKKLKLFGPYFSGRLNGAFRKVIQKGVGEPGKRSFDVSHLCDLHTFPVDGRESERGFLISDPSVFDYQTASVTFSVALQEAFNAYPRLFYCLSSYSPVIYNTDKGYEALYPQWHGVQEQVLVERGDSDIYLCLNRNEPVPKEVGFVAMCVGVH